MPAVRCDRGRNEPFTFVQFSRTKTEHFRTKTRGAFLNFLGHFRTLRRFLSAPLQGSASCSCSPTTPKFLALFGVIWRCLVIKLFSLQFLRRPRLQPVAVIAANCTSHAWLQPIFFRGVFAVRPIGNLQLICNFSQVGFVLVPFRPKPTQPTMAVGHIPVNLPRNLTC